VWEEYIDLNEQLAEEWADHVINQTKGELPEADEWADSEDKREFLIESWDEAEVIK
jgi:ferredoxin